ncbi:hypothetical protein [Nocardioides aquiterrae]|uniref:WD40 repeat domain-containing protein n=1 Tax=Nocardioides aquiterrae TaxID=203799 RepID=A0ABN1UJN2_9ACTN
MRALGLALALVLLLGSSPALADPVVVTPDDAVKARPGRDYTRLATIRPGEDGYPVGVTPAGRIVLQRYAHGGNTFTVLDPESGHRKRLPGPDRGSGLLRVTASEAWYEDVNSRTGRTTILRYRRDTGRVRSFRLPEEFERQVSYVIGLDGDTVWYGSAPPREDHADRNVWSIRFGHSGTLTPRGRHRGNPVYADGILAWTRQPDVDRPGQVLLQDVATGAVTTTEMPAGCSQRSNPIQSNGSEFVAVLACDHPEQKAIVVDRSGATTAILEIAMEDGAFGTSDRGVFFYDRFYDFATGRLLDVSDIGYGDIWPLGGPGEHPVQVWPQSGGKDLVVRLK